MFLEDLDTVTTAVDFTGANRILTDVHRIETKYRLRSYDASYLELALRWNIPTASLDNELSEACRLTGIPAF